MYYKASLHMITYFPNYQQDICEDFDNFEELSKRISYYRVYLLRNNVHADFDLILTGEKDVIQLCGAI